MSLPHKTIRSTQLSIALPWAVAQACPSAEHPAWSDTTRPCGHPFLSCFCLDLSWKENGKKISSHYTKHIFSCRDCIQPKHAKTRIPLPWPFQMVENSPVRNLPRLRNINKMSWQRVAKAMEVPSERLRWLPLISVGFIQLLHSRCPATKG